MDTLQHPELPGGIQEGSISTEVGVTALRERLAWMTEGTRRGFVRVPNLALVNG